MSLTPADIHWHKEYEEAPESLKCAVDDAHAAAIRALAALGFTTANDDRAESLIAAITRYVIESEPL